VTASLRSRLPFLCAVALVAAALADPLVESVSNTGIFGPRASDDNHLSIIPALIAGLVLLLEVAGLHCAALCRRPPLARERDWLVDVASRFVERSLARDLPYVFILQLAALFTMESVEQLVTGGSLAGGLAWLGGPIVFSLLVHALVGAGCMRVFVSSMRALLATFAALVLRALAFIAAFACAALPAFVRRACAFRSDRLQLPHLRKIGGRAPPSLLTPA